MKETRNRILKAGATVFGFGLFSLVLTSELIINNYCIDQSRIIYCFILGLVTPFPWYYTMRWFMSRKNRNKSKSID